MYDTIFSHDIFPSKRRHLTLPFIPPTQIMYNKFYKQYALKKLENEKSMEFLILNSVSAA